MDLRGTSRGGGGRTSSRFNLKLAVVCSIFLGIGSVLFLVTRGSSSTGTGACLEIIRSRRVKKVEALLFSTPVLKLDEHQRRRAVATGRRELAEAGSRPPICAYKCGQCTPCSPVHVQVPPSTAAAGGGNRDGDAAAYLPVAWWCRCHGRLYQP